MRNFLLGLILTLAVAASLIVIIDRFQAGGDPRDVENLSQRLAQVEAVLAGPKTTPEPDGKTDGVLDPNPGVQLPPGTATLSEVVTLLEEIEGMLLDSEKSLRRDLRGIYEKLLLRMEELESSGVGPAAGTADPATREALYGKLTELGVKVTPGEMIEVQGEILEPTRAIELIAVAPGGRAHESLLLVRATPSAMKIGLEDIGLVETDADPHTGKYPQEAKGAYIYVMWDGLKKPRRVEDLILNRATNDTMKRAPFMFTASRFYTDTRTWERHFAADVYKNVISLTWNWSVESIVACPLEEAQNENIWAPCADTCAKPGTKVRVFIRKEPNELWDKIG
ncbi:MAG: hypothetical protein CMJ83_00320 [Planctomycetes bacterium]|nr:hypothetical protein [Planctomycetota bacterium]